MKEQYQTVGFRFKVDFIGLGADGESADGQFQSVSGLDVSIETESFKEGGENRFEHRIPVRTKYSDLVLKRGLLLPESGSLVTDWCGRAFDNFGYGPYMRDPELEERDGQDFNEVQKPIVPISLQIALVGELEKPIAVWNVYHAWPKAWKIGELNAERSEVLIETIELQHNGFVYRKP